MERENMALHKINVATGYTEREYKGRRKITKRENQKRANHAKKHSNGLKKRK